MLCDCLICGEQFRTKPSYIVNGGGKYCSSKCYGKARSSLVERDCIICGKSFQRHPASLARGEGKYCSQKCHGEFRGKNQFGKNNNNWRGGLASETRKVRISRDYKAWQKAVFARDNWDCQDCGKHGGELNAHHVFGFTEFPEHRLDIWNGITLCRFCHQNTHRTVSCGM